MSDHQANTVAFKSMDVELWATDVSYEDIYAGANLGEANMSGQLLVLMPSNL